MPQNKLKSEIMEIAAELLRAEFLPSDLVDDYPQKTYTPSRIAKMMEPAHSKMRDIGYRLGRIANAVSMQIQ